MGKQPISKNAERLINAIVTGDHKELKEVKKIASGEKVILSTFLDCLKFTSCSAAIAKMESGEIELEVTEPIKSTIQNWIPGVESNTIGRQESRSDSIVRANYSSTEPNS